MIKNPGFRCLLKNNKHFLTLVQRFLIDSLFFRCSSTIGIPSTCLENVSQTNHTLSRYIYFEKGCRRKRQNSTGQDRKVIWVSGNHCVLKSEIKFPEVKEPRPVNYPQYLQGFPTTFRQNAGIFNGFVVCTVSYESSFFLRIYGLCFALRPSIESEITRNLRFGPGLKLNSVWRIILMCIFLEHQLLQYSEFNKWLVTAMKTEQRRNSSETNKYLCLRLQQAPGLLTSF